jgi:Tfp pilus assembly protein PilN
LKSPVDIWNDFTRVSKVLALEHCFTPKGVLQIGIALKQKKQEVFLEEHYQFESDEEFKTVSDRAAVLLISGKKVLSKKLSGQVDRPLAELADKAFERMDVSSLFFQRVDINGDTIISAIRRDTLEEILAFYSNKGIRIIDIKIGAVGVLPIYQALTIQAQHFGYHKVTEDHQIVLDENIADQELSISDQKLKAPELVGYLNGVQYLVGQNVENEIPEGIQELAKDERFRIAYKNLLFSVPAMLLVVLLASFFAFSHYYGENQKLERHTYEVNKRMSTLTSLKEKVNTKEAFLQNNTATQLNFTEMSDLIGASVPASMALESLEIYPVKKIHKRAQLLEFHGATLELKGHCYQYEDYKKWMEDLQDFSFVSQIEILGYGRSEEGSGDEFRIKLGLTE